jgi:hypothetical protein
MKGIRTIFGKLINIVAKGRPAGNADRTHEVETPGIGYLSFAFKQQMSQEKKNQELETALLNGGFEKFLRNIFNNSARY